MGKSYFLVVSIFSFYGFIHSGRPGTIILVGNENPLYLKGAGTLYPPALKLHSKVPHYWG